MRQRILQGLAPASTMRSFRPSSPLPSFARPCIPMMRRRMLWRQVERHERGRLPEGKGDEERLLGRRANTRRGRSLSQSRIWRGRAKGRSCGGEASASPIHLRFFYRRKRRKLWTRITGRWIRWCGMQCFFPYRRRLFFYSVGPTEKLIIP
jgi:hypothetical protein